MVGKRRLLKEFLKFGHVTIEEMESYYSQKTINVSKVDIEKNVVSNKFAWGKQTDVKYPYRI